MDRFTDDCEPLQELIGLTLFRPGILLWNVYNPLPCVQSHCNRARKPGDCLGPRAALGFQANDQ